MHDRSDYVAALERQNRILSRLTATCAALLVIAVACGARQIVEPFVVHESFTLKDRNGVNRFEMVVHEGTGLSNGFHVVDANGRTRIDIGVTARGEAVIGFFDADGKLMRTLP